MSLAQTKDYAYIETNNDKAPYKSSYILYIVYNI